MGDWYEKQTIGLLPERAAERWGAREALAFQGKRLDLCRRPRRRRRRREGAAPPRHRAR